jgi:hypothetical protein
MTHDIQKLTFHPTKHKMREALWMANYFGASLWGIRFPNEEKVYRLHEINKAHDDFGPVEPMDDDDDDPALESVY